MSADERVTRARVSGPGAGAFTFEHVRPRPSTDAVNRKINGGSGLSPAPGAR